MGIVFFLKRHNSSKSPGGVWKCGSRVVYIISMIQGRSPFTAQQDYGAGLALRLRPCTATMEKKKRANILQSLTQCHLCHNRPWHSSRTWSPGPPSAAQAHLSTITMYNTLTHTTDTHTQAYTQTHIHTETHIHTDTHTHTERDINTDTDTYTHIYTYTYTALDWRAQEEG